MVLTELGFSTNFYLHVVYIAKVSHCFVLAFFGLEQGLHYLKVRIECLSLFSMSVSPP